MTKGIPKVLVLGPITPTEDGDYLRYEKLSEAVLKHRPHEAERWRRYLGALGDSLEEEEIARQLAQQYMLETGAKEVSSQDPNSKRIWADRYTQASSELYGVPNEKIAESLMSDESAALSRMAELPAVDKDLLAKVLAVYNSQTAEDLERPSNNVESHEFGEASLVLRAAIYERFEPILELANTKSVFTSDEVAVIFREAIRLIAEEDSSWEEWSVEQPEDKDSLSVKGGKDKKILVGAKRRNVASEEFKGLLSHELLVHALRSVNGSHLSDELSTGLPGYLDFEEGLGVFFEYAITGVIPQKIIDRYTDIYLALGIRDGNPMPRAAMLEFVNNREIIRAQASGADIDEDEIRNKVSAHVNRIYRGTTGDDDAIGVFTKDIVYFKGFYEAAAYIRDGIVSGRSIHEIMNYLLLGKFNPLDERHLSYLEQKKQILRCI